MLKEAIHAKIPVIGVHTDDLVNVEDVLQSIALQKKVVSFDIIAEKGTPLQAVYYCYEDKYVTLNRYNQFKKVGASLVVVNPKPSPLIFDAGAMPVPQDMMEERLGFLGHKQIAAVLPVLKGMSLKAAGDVIALTISRTGGVLPKEVRKTRLMVAGGIEGLMPLDTADHEFYVWPEQIKTWLDTNQKFFEDLNTPKKLVPRGLMLEGQPGVGKTMAARVIAHQLNIPLYRLDITQALNRYIGESEGRVARSLALADQEAPCVILFDEVEKVLSKENDSGTVTRILSQLLWWLQEHTSRVITVMTTNSLKDIPPELYRPGRLDAVYRLPKLGLKDAKAFASEVYKDVMGVSPTMSVQARLREAIEATGYAELAHAEVAETVYDAIKKLEFLK